MKKSLFIGASAFLPFLAFAAAPTTADVNEGYFQGIIEAIQNLVNILIPLLIALALLFFIWGLVTFILAAGDEAARAEGRSKMIWGIIALFVIVSVWGLVALLNQLTGVGQNVQVMTPAIPSGTGGGGAAGGPTP